MPDAASGLVYYVVFLFSTTLHEAAHAWAAKLGGDLTAYHGGQVTLDPRPHIKREPLGMLLLPLLTAVTRGFPIGFASAPYDPEWALRHPRRSGWMALAGPAANIVLAILALAMIKIGLVSGVFSGPQEIRFGHLVESNGEGLLPGLAFLVSAFYSMNLALAVLNLLPVPPFDGSAAVTVLLDDDKARRYKQFLFKLGPGVALVSLLIAWQVFTPIFTPIFFGTVELLYPGRYH
jgi:Zn-dependent protease